MTLQFENLVNSDRCKTCLRKKRLQARFENLVNSDRFKTILVHCVGSFQFLVCKNLVTLKLLRLQVKCKNIQSSACLLILNHQHQGLIIMTIFSGFFIPRIRGFLFKLFKFFSGHSAENVYMRLFRCFAAVTELERLGEVAGFN